MTISLEEFLRRENLARPNFVFTHLGIPISIVLSLLYANTTYGAPPLNDVGMYGSVQVSEKAHDAATALKQNRYANAQGLYKSLIGMRPLEDDFYFGLYIASKKMNQWSEVGGALEQLFQHAPKYKNQMSMEYGECLYNLNRYSEAEPVLKLALANISKPSIVEKRIRRLIDKSIIRYKPVVGAPAVPLTEPDFTPVAPPPIVDQVAVHPDTSPVDLKLKTAFLKSEAIVIADYKKFEKRKGMISYYNPPKAVFKIKDILKGPPLNPTLYLRFEFHDRTNKPKPKGWKFNEKEIMPKKGSRWIIFIGNAVSMDGMYDSYHGSWGRIPYTEDNIDKVLHIREKHKGQAH